MTQTAGVSTTVVMEKMLASNVLQVGLEVIKNSYSTYLSKKHFLLINVKMPTIVGILTSMSRKNRILGLSEPDKC